MYVLLSFFILFFYFVLKVELVWLFECIEVFFGYCFVEVIVIYFVLIDVNLIGSG